MKKLNNTNTNKKQPTTSRFIEKITVMTATRGKYNKFKVNKAEDGKKYQFAHSIRNYTRSLKVGDVVMIAKLRHTHRSNEYVWDVYKVTLPAFVYEYNGKETYVPKTWFGNNSYLVI